MKRAIVIFLATAMIVSLFCGLCFVNAAAEDQVKMYWDFENTTIEDMKTNTGNAFYADGNVSIVSGGANGSASALKVSGMNSGNGQWLNGLTPNTTYTMYFWAKYENRDAAAWPNFGVQNFGGDGVTYSSWTNDWTLYSMDFTTGASNTSAQVWCWTFGSGNVDFFVDDAIVVKKATSDWQFWNAEAGVPALLKTMPGYYSTNATVAAGGAKRTDNCIKITGVNSGNGSWINGLTPSTTYVVTYWAKAVCDADVYPTFGVQNFGGDGVSRNTWTSSWAKYSLEFTTGASNTNAQLWTWVFGAGSSEFYIDEVTVAVKQAAPAAENPLSAWDFEAGSLAPLGTADSSDADGYYAVGNLSVVSGGANGTDYALNIPAANCGNGQTVNGLAPLTNYTVTYWAKVASCDAGVYPNFGVNSYDANGSYVANQSFTSDWAQYSLNFTTGTDCTSAQIYTWVFGEGNCEFLLDEVSITANGGVLEAWNCEHNDMNVLTANSAYYNSGNVSIVDGGVNGSDYALLVSGVNCGNGQWLNNLNPNTEYEITFWAKTENRAADGWPNVGVSDFGGAANAITIFATEWTQYTLSFTTGASNTQAKLYTWIFGPGTADLFVDDVEIHSVPHVHSFTAGETVAPTCETAGYTVYTCTCGETENRDSVPALGHSYIYTNNGDDHTVGCSRCAYSVTEAHTFVEGVCVCGAEEVTENIDNNLTFATVNLQLESYIGADFFFLKTKVADYDSYYVRFTYPTADGDVTEDLPAEEYGKYFFAEHTVAAKEMSDTIQATIYAVKDGVTFHGPTTEWTLKNAMRTKFDGAKSTEADKALCVAILNYGAKAQARFSYNVEDLATSVLTAEEIAAYLPAARAAVSVDATTSTGKTGVSFYKMALSAGSVTVLNVMFTKAAATDIDDVECRISYTDRAGVDQVEVIDSFTASGSRFVALFNKLTAKQLGDTISITFYSKTSGEPISETKTFSEESYIALNPSANEAQTALYTALIQYADAAAAKFA